MLLELAIELLSKTLGEWASGVDGWIVDTSKTDMTTTTKAPAVLKMHFSLTHDRLSGGLGSFSQVFNFAPSMSLGASLHA